MFTQPPPQPGIYILLYNTHTHPYTPSHTQPPPPTHTCLERRDEGVGVDRAVVPVGVVRAESRPHGEKADVEQRERQRGVGLLLWLFVWLGVVVWLVVG